jgi:hypothetical protein
MSIRLAAFATSHDTSPGAVIKVQPPPPTKSKPGVKALGLNFMSFTALKLMLDRFIPLDATSVTPGILLVIKVFDLKEGENAFE